MKICARILFFVLLMLTVSLFAQTEIVKEDVMNVAGSVGTYEISNTGAVAVDLLEEGAGKTWDFTQLTMGSSPNIDEYTFQSEIYSGANYVMKESHQDDTTWYVHTYVRLSDDSLKIIARKMKDFEGISIRWAGPDDYYALPLALGTSWVSVQQDTFTFGNDLFISTNTSKNTVDASGTVKLPVGDFECLRLRTVSEEKSDGNVFRYIKYTFLAKNNLLVALAQGQPDDTTHNFSSAVYVQRFISLETRIDNNKADVPEKFFLAQNYPNPFNPRTRINFDLPIYSRLELAVYNLKGERIRTLHSGYLIPGSYSFIWDGTDFKNRRIASGMYIYRLRCRGHVQSRRMILIR